MRKTIHRLWHLSAGQWGHLCLAASIAVAVRAGLRVLTLPTLVRQLRSLTRTLSLPGDLTETYQEKAIWAASAAATRIAPTNVCLVQALVLQAMLRLRGDAKSRLHIGVSRNSSGEIEAHAWITGKTDEIVIGGDHASGNYKKLDGLTSQLQNEVNS